MGGREPTGRANDMVLLAPRRQGRGGARGASRRSRGGTRALMVLEWHHCGEDASVALSTTIVLVCWHDEPFCV